MLLGSHRLNLSINTTTKNKNNCYNGMVCYGMVFNMLKITS